MINVINILAVIVAPIVAVIVGQYLQDRAEKRKDKIEIFKALMVSRYGWSFNSVQAMNIIEIVFFDDKKVLEAWKDFYDKSCIEKPTDTQIKKMQIAKDRLLEAMAHSLGYKDKVTWETIQNPYIPKGMVDSMQQQQMIQNGQAEFAKVAGVFAQIVNPATVSEQPKQQEDKPDAHA